MSTRIALVSTGALSLAILAGLWYFTLFREDGPLFSPVASSSKAEPIVSELFQVGEEGVRDLSTGTSDSPKTEEGIMAEYKNDAYLFSLRHPSDQNVTLHEYGDGSTNIVFENEDLSSGFQIFVTPYIEPTITKARFLEDQPSGTLSEPVAISVAGASGMMFYGQNADIGETIEIWFVRNGFLYEVYTYKSLEESLKEMLRTWTFSS